HLVSSKARRAAAIARCMSAFDASATSPSRSSVAGLMLANVPASPSTSLPSINMRGSKRSVDVSAMDLTWIGGGRQGRRRALAPTQRAVTREAQHETDHAPQDSRRENAAREQQQLRVGADGVPGERSPLVERLRECPREAF